MEVPPDVVVRVAVLVVVGVQIVPVGASASVCVEAVRAASGGVLVHQTVAVVVLVADAGAAVAIEIAGDESAAGVELAGAVEDVVCDVRVVVVEPRVDDGNDDLWARSADLVPRLVGVDPLEPPEVRVVLAPSARGVEVLVVRDVAGLEHVVRMAVLDPRVGREFVAQLHDVDGFGYFEEVDAVEGGRQRGR